MSELAHRPRLQRIAREALLSRGLEPDFPPEVIRQVDRLDGPADPTRAGLRDLRGLTWCSIDNDDSRDLDQLSTSKRLSGDRVEVLVAIADVDALVPQGSPVDLHAARNTTSIYTAARVFPMLPERLSTDLTSLNPNEDRVAVVVRLVVDSGGVVQESDVFRAAVRNVAKLAYPSLGAWLEDRGDLPPAAARVPGLADQLRDQDRAAQALRERRHEEGALDLETIEAKAVFEEDHVVDLVAEATNRAKQLIEEVMIASNGVVARFLDEHRFPSLRRVVRSPERWARIVDLAADFGERLPDDPDSLALEKFLVRRRKADPLRFPDLSLDVVKLMGRGEYEVHEPGKREVGHFGLATMAYTHATAPNRRYPDLVEQRLVKAALAGAGPPLSAGEVASLADHCTAMEDAAAKAERHVRKSAAALLLSSRVGDRFDAVVTGASSKGTWVRIFKPPVEGRLDAGDTGLKVGKRLAVRLVRTDVDRGFIDFARA